MKQFGLIFGIAFVLNLIWENLHSLLYTHYQGGAITELILLRATLFDALFISLLFLLTLRMKLKRSAVYVRIGLSFLVAVLIEIFALATTRWAYAPTMPIIPILEVGLTPVVQLPLLAWISVVLLTKVEKLLKT